MSVKVIAVVGARLNSSRLPRKHLLNLAGAPLISRIFERLETISELDKIILATTDDAYNQPLIQWAEEHGKDVFAYQGDVNHLMGRVDAVVQKYNPEVVVYACGDSPLIEPGTISSLVNQLLRDPMANIGRIASFQARPPIHEGFNVYARELWDQMMAASLSAHHREHVGSILAEGHIPLHYADVVDAPHFYECEHRLSVDTPSDYAFMSQVYQRWYQQNPADSLVSLPTVIQWLQTEPSLRAINQHVRQKTVLDQSAKILMLTAVGPKVGLGHLSRLLALTTALQDHLSAGVQFLIDGPALVKEELEFISHQFSAHLADDLFTYTGLNVIVVDLPTALVDDILRERLALFRGQGVLVVSIDLCLPRTCVDLSWVPSFYLKESGEHVSGWPCFLLGKNQLSETKKAALVVLTGGSDFLGLGETLPTQFEQTLPKHTVIHYIQGPYASAPKIPTDTKLHWQVHVAPEKPRAIVAGCQLAFAVYGVSFFECLQEGLATVTYVPQNISDGEVVALDEAKVCLRANQRDGIAPLVATLFQEQSQRDVLALKARQLMDGQGPERLAKAIKGLLSAPQ